VSTNRKDNRKRRKRSGKGKKSFTPTQFEQLQCAICGESIKDVTSAMCMPEEDNPCHFDCVIQALAEKEPLKEDEKIIYMGSNHFAIVQESEYNKRNFSILRTIDFPRKDNRENWRANMKQELSV